MLALAPFVPAAIGGAAALLVAGITHAFTSRRDKNQWKRQLEQQVGQWDRERKERQDQWDREDQARWDKDRFAMYAAMLSSCEKWIRVTRQEKPFPLVGRNRITSEGEDRLEGLEDEIGRQLDELEFVAPEAVLGKARGMAVRTMLFRMNYGSIDRSNSEEDPGDVEGRADRDLNSVIDQCRSTREAMKRDVGLHRKEHPSGGE